MNCGEYTLVQSNSQLALQPAAELNFADFLINQVVDAAFCVGANAQFLYVNDATSRMTEYSREELLSMSLNDIDIDFSLHDWLEKWRCCASKLQSQPSFIFKSRYRTKRSRIFWVEVTITYVKHQGRDFGYVFAREKSDEVVDLSLQKSINELKDSNEILQQEITALKRKEIKLETSLSLLRSHIDISDTKQTASEILYALTQAKQLSEIRVQFVSMLCHQFRTPLNVVSFSNSLLKRHINEWTGEKIRTLLDRIQISVEHISHLLDDLLFFTKAEAAKLNFQPKPLDLVSFCNELVTQIQISSSQHRINFVTQGNCGRVCMDEKLLEPMLKNLLENAINYSPNYSPVDMKLSCRKQKVIFEIQDTGIGIPVADQQRLFEPFYRGSNHNIHGTGLGLSIVKTLVDLQGGQITVESEVDIGTIVTVILPVSSSTVTP
ncbi:MAG: ATP-binding protein [Gloeotrichia echinulata DVL01]|jgi:PAS domain S-box-containing protein